ncbi:PREDICTED: angiopoietin-related protein 2-like [Drosophila arizonae]|uniref:Angiopoietin-related protein 2-like n=1 Tax=Drosophila arizonae TaxID=7263 RepID=A0ABM1PCD5_DROAR|nr:PREDICTED: angiopoietin-related protein 2-like [Drosophila arizonae]
MERCAEVFAIVIALSAATLANKAVDEHQLDKKLSSTFCNGRIEYFEEKLALKTKEVDELQKKVDKINQKGDNVVVLDALKEDIETCQKELREVESNVEKYEDQYLKKKAELADAKEELIALRKENHLNVSKLNKPYLECIEQLKLLKYQQFQVNQYFEEHKKRELVILDNIEECERTTMKVEEEMAKYVDMVFMTMHLELLRVERRSQELTCDAKHFAKRWITFSSRGGSGRKFNVDVNALAEVAGHTARKASELYVNLVDRNGMIFYARYNNFKIANKTEDFKLLSLGQYTGTAGDGMRIFEGKRFSTKDSGPRKECAEKNNANWWYGECNPRFNEWLASDSIAYPLKKFSLRLLSPENPIH